jgi:hypothetical protein
LAGGSTVKKEFECRHIPTVALSGQIVPSDLIHDNSTQLVITYIAFWSHEFYGITDGAVVQIQVADVSPDANGMFQVNLPDFSEDITASSMRQNASFYLRLRDSKTWHAIASDLDPELLDFRSEYHGLRIQSYYPSGLKFAPQPNS